MSRFPDAEGDTNARAWKLELPVLGWSAWVGAIMGAGSLKASWNGDSLVVSLSIEEAVGVLQA